MRQRRVAEREETVAEDPRMALGGSNLNPWLQYHQQLNTQTQFTQDNLQQVQDAVCPRSTYPFYIVSYYTKWVTTSWTYCMHKFSYHIPLLIDLRSATHPPHENTVDGGRWCHYVD